MKILHRIKNRLTPIQSKALLYEALYHDSGGFTLDKYFNDPRFFPQVKNRHMLRVYQAERLKATYEQYGREYFTEAEYKALYDEGQLEQWLEWVRGTKVY